MALRAVARGIAHAIERGCQAAAIALGGAVFVLMLAGIAGRHVLSEGLPAVTELPEQLFPWWVMASVVLAARAGAHVAVEAIVSALGPARRTFARLGLVLTVALSGGVVWTVARVSLIAGGDRSPILGVPLVHLHAAIAVGFLLVGVLALCALIDPEPAP